MSHRQQPPFIDNVRLDPLGFEVCSKSGNLSRTLLRMMRRAAFVVAVASKTNTHLAPRNVTAGEFRGGHGGAASQTGMGRKGEFSGLGLHRVRMGAQPFMAAHWRIN